MKDFNREAYEESSPIEEAEEVIEFCLKKLFDDTEHTHDEEIVYGLTFEELIGALLTAKDELKGEQDA